MYSAASGDDGCVVLLGDGALEAAQHVALLPVELRVREAEPHDALRLGEERVEPAIDVVVLDRRAEHRRFLGAHEQPAARAGAQERRVRLLGDLGEARRSACP